MSRRKSQPHSSIPIADKWRRKGIRVAYARMDELIGIANGSPKISITSDGIGLGINTDFAGETADYVVNHAWASNVTKDNGTIGLLFRQVHASTAGFLFDFFVSGSRYRLNNASGTLKVEWGTTTGASTGHTISTTTPDSLILTWDSPSTPAVYANGDDVTPGGLPTVAASPTTAALSAYSASPASTSFRARGDYVMFFIGSKGLSPQDAREISENPWCLFKSRRPATGFVAAVGGGFQAAWARQRTKSIGLR